MKRGWESFCPRGNLTPPAYPGVGLSLSPETVAPQGFMEHSAGHTSCSISWPEEHLPPRQAPLPCPEQAHSSYHAAHLHSCSVGWEVDQAKLVRTQMHFFAKCNSPSPFPSPPLPTSTAKAGSWDASRGLSFDSYPLPSRPGAVPPIVIHPFIHSTNTHWASITRNA